MRRLLRLRCALHAGHAGLHTARWALYTELHAWYHYAAYPSRTHICRQVVMDDEERQMVADAAAADAADEAQYADEVAAPAPQAMVVVEDTEEDRPIKIVKNYVRPVRGAGGGIDLQGVAKSLECMCCIKRACSQHRLLVYTLLPSFFHVDTLLPFAFTPCFPLFSTFTPCFSQATRGAPKAFDPTKMVVSPITGELIPLSDMEEHMRVSLIDPRWREQREAMISKIRDTTRAADDEIARNLVGLAKTRPDIFGTSIDLEERKKRARGCWVCIMVKNR